MFDFRAERVIKSVDESLQRMGLEYVDLIQIHDMEFAPSLDVIINETLPALQKVEWKHSDFFLCPYQKPRFSKKQWAVYDLQKEQQENCYRHEFVL